MVVENVIQSTTKWHWNAPYYRPKWTENYRVKMKVTKRHTFSPSDLGPGRTMWEDRCCQTVSREVLVEPKWSRWRLLYVNGHQTRTSSTESECYWYLSAATKTTCHVHLFQQTCISERVTTCAPCRPSATTTCVCPCVDLRTHFSSRALGTRHQREPGFFALMGGLHVRYCPCDCPVCHCSAYHRWLIRYVDRPFRARKVTTTLLFTLVSKFSFYVTTHRQVISHYHDISKQLPLHPCTSDFERTWHCLA